MENILKFQQMQEEMSRFEAEISGSDAAVACFMRPVIAAGAFGAMQQSMDMGAMAQYHHAGLTAMMYQPMAPPPPPPPLPMMLPEQMRNDFGQVQQLRPPAYPVHLGLPNHLEFQPMQFHYHSMPGPQIMGPPLIPPRAPQPIVLSAKPLLYNKTKDMLKKEKREKKRKHKAQLLKATQNAGLAVEPVVVLPPSPAVATTPTEVVVKPKKEKKNKKMVRAAGGQVWEDATMLDWAEDDFRMFCGDLGNDVTDELLIRTFSKYPSFQRAKVVRDKRTNKSKGFGFISFKDPGDFIKCMKEMDGRYVGSRPIKLRKSTWKHRSLDVVRKKEKEKDNMISVLMSFPT